MNLLLLCVGKLKHSYLQEGCSLYAKRLSHYGRVEIAEVADSPEDQDALRHEGERLLARIKPEDYVVLLSPRGKAYTSEAWADQWRIWDQRSRVVLIIGGSLGVDRSIEARAQQTISFSQFTMPHGLMRLVLLEQLYRARKIIAGERYHK